MKINWKTIDLQNWERRTIYGWFKDFDFPYSVIGAELDITTALAVWKQRKISPYLAMIYAATRAANLVPAFRLRIRGEQVIEHECVHADFTVLEANELFNIRTCAYDVDFATFYRGAEQARRGPAAEFDDAPEGCDHFVFLSVLPWTRFTHAVQPATKKIGSIPRIVWGQFAAEQNKTMMPISVQTHHALVDGVHISRYLQLLQEMLNQAEDIYSISPEIDKR